MFPSCKGPCADFISSSLSRHVAAAQLFSWQMCTGEKILCVEVRQPAVPAVCEAGTSLNHSETMANVIETFFCVQEAHLVQPLRARASLQWRPLQAGRGNALVVCMAHNLIPEAPLGLYDPEDDKDACGVGFVAELDKVPTRACVVDAIEALRRMTHRGACGCEVNTGTLSLYLGHLPCSTVSVQALL